MSPFKRQRLAAGLTVAQLADKLGVSRGTVSNWENGVGQPSPRFFPKLAEIFGISAEEVTHLFDKPADLKADQSLEGGPPPSVAPTADTIPA